MSYCRFAEGDVYAYECDGGVQFYVSDGRRELDRLCSTFNEAYQYARVLRDTHGLDVPSHAIEALKADALEEAARICGPDSAVAELEGENAKLRGFWTHDGTWHVELPKLPEGIAVTMPDECDREVRTARVWRYEPVRTCSLVKEHVGRSGQAHRLVCSECHHVIYDGWQDKPRYCAFCGARMEDE